MRDRGAGGHRRAGALLELAMVLLPAACSMQERSDFLVGRPCDPGSSDLTKGCDPGQSCLPHTYAGDTPKNYLCRDRASFDPLPDGRPAPLAYCNPSGGFSCPGDLVCTYDRIRADASVRRLVCASPDDPFAPPAPDGGAL